MTQLVQLADVLRSKNAGPFQITIDIFFPNLATHDRVWAANVLTPEVIGSLYGVDRSRVVVLPFRRVLAIKITLDRPLQSSGSPNDTDVYGAQQHAPLMALEIP